MQSQREEEVKTKKQKTNLDRSTSWFVYPPPIISGGSSGSSSSSQAGSFQIGDEVFVRSKSVKERGQRGHIIAKTATAATTTTTTNATNNSLSSQAIKTTSTTTGTATTSSELVVKLDDGREKKLKRCIRVFDSQQQQQQQNQVSMIVLTAETMSYRILSSSQLTEHDVVLEIGCSTGEASIIMKRYCCDWMGFDTSDEMIETCRTQLGTSAKVHKIDALSDPIRAEQLVMDGLQREPNKVFLDIGGNREYEGVLRMIAWVLSTFSPTLLVVKSRELVGRLVEDLSVADYTGLITDGDSWMRQQMSALKRKIPKHPLQAPARCMDGTPICRYHNYHAEGCKRFRCGKCEFDHHHCHMCLDTGHVALKCPLLGT